MPAYSLNIVLLDGSQSNVPLTQSLRDCGHQVRTLHHSDLLGGQERNGAVDLLVIDSAGQDPQLSDTTLRFRKAYPWAGILVLTPAQQASLRRRAFQSGADLVLQKPLIADELAAAMGAMSHWLRRIQLARTPDCEHLILHQSSLLLRGPLTVLKLSDTEATVLTALSLAKSQRLSYEALCTLIRDQLNTHSKVNMEVRMVRLRSKLNLVGAQQPSICALRNHGYQLLVEVEIK